MTTPNSATPIEFTDLWGQFKSARLALRQARTATAGLIAALRAKGLELGQFLRAHHEQLGAGQFDPWLRGLGIPRSTAYRLMLGPAALELRGNTVTLTLSDEQAQALRDALARLQDPNLPSFNLAEDWLRALIRRCRGHLHAAFADVLAGYQDRFASYPSLAALCDLPSYRIPRLAAAA